MVDPKLYPNCITYERKGGTLLYVNITGPVASNHGNRYTAANFPVIWNYGVPNAKVNGTDLERGENGERNWLGNGRGRPTGTETDRERQKGRQTGVRRTMGIGSEKASVGGERVGVPGVLRVKGCRLDSALTTSGTDTTGDWSWH